MRVTLLALGGLDGFADLLQVEPCRHAGMPGRVVHLFVRLSNFLDIKNAVEGFLDLPLLRPRKFGETKEEIPLQLRVRDDRRLSADHVTSEFPRYGSRGRGRGTGDAPRPLRRSVLRQFRRRNRNWFNLDSGYRNGVLTFIIFCTIVDLPGRRLLLAGGRFLLVVKGGSDGGGDLVSLPAELVNVRLPATGLPHVLDGPRAGVVQLHQP